MTERRHVRQFEIRIPPIKIQFSEESAPKGTTHTATPSDFSSKLSALRSGDTLQLRGNAGVYPAFTLPSRSDWGNAVTTITTYPGDPIAVFDGKTTATNVITLGSSSSYANKFRVTKIKVQNGKNTDRTNGIFGYGNDCVFEDIEVTKCGVGTTYWGTRNTWRRCNFHHCGQLGANIPRFAGSNGEGLVEDCNFDDNNTGQYDGYWEAGGLKRIGDASGVTGNRCTYRRCTAHRNIKSVGMWVDWVVHSCSGGIVFEDCEAAYNGLRNWFLECSRNITVRRCKAYGPSSGTGASGTSDGFYCANAQYLTFEDCESFCNNRSGYSFHDDPDRNANDPELHMRNIILRRCKDYWNLYRPQDHSNVVFFNDVENTAGPHNDYVQNAALVQRWKAGNTIYSNFSSWQAAGWDTDSTARKPIEIPADLLADINAKKTGLALPSELAAYPDDQPEPPEPEPPDPNPEPDPELEARVDALEGDVATIEAQMADMKALLDRVESAWCAANDQRKSSYERAATDTETESESESRRATEARRAATDA
jgi:hypothetical protein